MSDLVSVALSQFGVKQHKEGKKHPQIVNYFTSIGFNEKKIEKTKTWSSAFVNWVAKQSGYEYTSKLSARSWLSIGESTANPKQGDVVVLWEENRSCLDGYTGFFIKETEKYIYVLGGSQSKGVSIQGYPKTRILDYRKLRKK